MYVWNFGNFSWFRYTYSVTVTLTFDSGPPNSIKFDLAWQSTSYKKIIKTPLLFRVIPFYWNFVLRHKHTYIQIHESETNITPHDFMDEWWILVMFVYISLLYGLTFYIGRVSIPVCIFVCMFVLFSSFYMSDSRSPLFVHRLSSNLMEK